MYDASTWTKKVVSLVLLMAAIAFAPQLAKAQDIVINWASNSDKPESYPTSVNRAQPFPVKITNINDILYTYKVTHFSQSVPPDVFANISEAMGRALRIQGAGGALAPCEAFNKLEKVTKSIDDMWKEAEKLDSIPLAQSIETWDKIWAQLKTLDDKSAEKEPCDKTGQEKYAAAYPTVAAQAQLIQQRRMSNHEFQDIATIGPDTLNTFTVTEFFKGAQTKKTKTVTFSTGSDRLVLSAGVLFSGVPDRSYQARKTPASTENVLVVEGNSKYRPEGVLLLNFALPIPELDSDKAGFALSAGPVVRFGSNSEASGLGFFTGISAHINRLIYITPGLHFGQFADFPVGFGEGSTIPANFGELTPVKRWTGRFALAVSFRTKSFSGLGKTESSTPPKVTDSAPTDPKKTDPKGGAKPTSFINSKDRELFAARTPTVYVAQPDQAVAEIPASADASSSYNSKLPVRNVASVGGKETPDGLSISINADAPLGDYKTSLSGTHLFVIIPHAKSLFNQGMLRGNGLINAEVQQRGDDLVLIFALSPNTRASIQEKFNRLDIKFSAPTTLSASVQ